MGTLTQSNSDTIFNHLKKKHSSPEATVLLQETHSTVMVKDLWTSQWSCAKGSIYFSQGTSNCRRVFIAFHEGLDVKIEEAFTDKGRRLLILQSKIQDSPVMLVN